MCCPPKLSMSLSTKFSMQHPLKQPARSVTQLPPRLASYPPKKVRMSEFTPVDVTEAVIDSARPAGVATIAVLTHAPNDLTVLHHALTQLPADFMQVAGIDLQAMQS